MRRVVRGVGRGLAAGFAGTVALTISQRIEMRITGRPASDLPARVAEAALGISPKGRARDAVAFATHWFNNSVSGLNRALAAGVGLRGIPAAVATFVLYAVGGTQMFKRLGLATKPTPRQAAIDVTHAAVWATATSLAYEALAGRRAGEPPVPTGDLDSIRNA